MALDFPSNPEVGETYETAGNIYTWTGDRWMARSYRLEYPVPIYTNMVLTTPRDQGTELTAEGEILETQEQVNDLLASAASKVARATSRAVDQVDFLQNSVGKGTWLVGEGVIDGDDYPGPGEFWANGTEFNAITKFKFNDSGLPGFTNPGSLEGTRVGDYLTVQTNDNNSFGQYVIKGLETENMGKAGLIIRTLDVALIRNARSLGELHPLDRCSVTVSRPMSVIVQDTQPVVSTRGIFWYREHDDHLLISNYGDGFTGEGPQWTDLTSGDAYLPLTGGTIDGQVIINKGPLLVNGAQVVELPTGGDLFTVLGSDNGDAILAINGAGSGKYLGKQTVDENIATLGYVGDNYLPLKGGSMAGDIAMNGYKITSLGQATQGGMAVSRNYGDTRYLQLAAGGQITGYVQFKDDTKLQMGGTYNNNIIDGKEGFTDNSIVATLGFVNHAVANSAVGLPHGEKMYLQGFYPWRFAEGTNPNEGEWVAKTYDYNVVLDPASWKMLYFSVVDAYGRDLAGKFLNHMDFNNYRELQMWFAREDGTKICSYIGRMKCRDQNFEDRFTVDMDASDKELLISPKWDTASLEITRGEVIWVKCSAWGN